MTAEENTDLQSARRTMDKEIEALRMMEDELNGNLSKALDLMQSTKGRVIVTGMGKSGHIGSKIAATLGMITNDDIVVAISNSGETKELSDIIIYCKRYGIPLIAITKNADSALGRAGDILLQLPNDGEACPLGLAPTSSTTATLVLGDILAVCLLERKGFSKTDFRQRHPGGKLGSFLQKVSDLMHKGNEIPLVNENASMQEALLMMTSKMLGCVGIIDKQGNLEGIITDGDLRRCLSPDMLTKTAGELMTRSPKTIRPDILAAEAVNLMNGKGITQLFVTEDDKPVGIIHLHDCLRAGVA